MRNLKAFAMPEYDDDSSSDMERAPLPQPCEVLYTPPNPDGSNKSCSKCVFYATGRGQCYIHEPTLSIRPNAVCGYHIYSPAPMRIFTSVIPMMAVTPEQSGLIDTESGTSCDQCQYYAIDEKEEWVGECMAVIDKTGLPAFVQAKGCCARWSQGLDGTAALAISDEDDISGEMIGEE